MKNQSLQKKVQIVFLNEQLGKRINTVNKYYDEEPQEDVIPSKI